MTSPRIFDNDGVTAPARDTGFAWHELFMWHGHASVGVAGSGDLAVEPGDYGEESPHPRRRLRNLLEVSGVIGRLQALTFETASREQLEAVHTSAYVSRIDEESRRGGGLAGEVTPFGLGGFHISALAAGACTAAVDAVLTGDVDNAYALVRPAGHHALPDAGRGFCIFANASVAVRHAQKAYGLQRVAIVDWDVHHGNGAQAIFWDDPNVLTISLHQADWYPRGEGNAEELGEGPALGRNINVPLPPGSGIGAYRCALERVVLPALRGHAPELIVVSCGLDANAMDPSARMLLTSEDFRELTRRCREAADELCGGRLVLCQEGGYSPTYVPFCGLAIVEELAGYASGVRDPFLARYQGVGFELLQSHQEEVVEHVRRLVEQAGGPLA
jgi:acetoin utilization deacetylase AcuC-like enzyme